MQTSDSFGWLRQCLAEDNLVLICVICGQHGPTLGANPRVLSACYLRFDSPHPPIQPLPHERIIGEMRIRRTHTVDFP